MEDVNSWMRGTHEIQENLATKISNDSTVLKIGKKKIIWRIALVDIAESDRLFSRKKNNRDTLY